MGATTLSELQRTEVELVIGSGLFAKAPRLERFFRYICDCELQGQGDRVKEYSIAVEALGRPGEFDPKKDSIVRVEAHRLRKRLEQFYSGPGAHHPIHIAIPNGQYRPRFTLQETATEQRQDEVSPPEAPRGFAAIDVLAVPSGVPVTVGTTILFKRQRAWLWPTLLAGGCAAVLIPALLIHAARSRIPPLARPAVEVWNGSPTAPSITGEFRMLAGYHGGSFSDRQGHVWVPDAFYRGGISSPLPATRLLNAQPDTQFIRAQRSGQFEYKIPLRQCSYELHLYMIETEYGRGNPKGGGDGARMFQVSINGEPRLKLFDPLAEAGGPNRLYERVFKDIQPQNDGKLRLTFDPVVGPAILNAIELLPSPKGRIHPVRIVAQESPVTDSDGRLWAADKYFSGGTIVLRRNVITNSPEAVYQGERYGNFSYRIPLAPGKYRLTLHFAETWFGTPESNEPALGGRIFNVFGNGVALLRDFQIAKEAGGPNRGITKVFENLEPNAQGTLLLEFVPVRNYAEINAIEVVETG